MKKFALFLCTISLLISMSNILPAVAADDATYAAFIKDDGMGSIIVRVSDQYAKGRIIMLDLMIKKAWLIENNPDLHIVSATTICSATGHIQALFIHYEKPGFEFPNIEEENKYSSSVTDDNKGSVFIESANPIAPNMETVTDDLMVKKAWWIKNNPSKRVISVIPFYSPNYHLYGFLIHYEPR